MGNRPSCRIYDRVHIHSSTRHSSSLQYHQQLKRVIQDCLQLAIRTLFGLLVLCTIRALQSYQRGRGWQRITATSLDLPYCPGYTGCHAAYSYIDILSPAFPHDAIASQIITSNWDVHSLSISTTRSPELRRNEEATESEHAQEPRFRIEL